jgi:beta-lactamase regulating signal transducer with metallopeptidase domain
MMWPQFQSVAEIAIGSILNSLPEGLLITLFAWVLLRCLPKQNSGIRFAVWFMALVAVAGLPFLGGITRAHSLLPTRVAHPLLTLPGHWALLLFLVWAVSVLIGMVRLAAGLWHLRELCRSCVAIEAAALDPLVRNTFTGFDSSRSVTLATSERVSVPAAIGFFSPMIVIPAWALRELPPDELNIILLHELAHLSRWDDWTNLVQKIVRAIFVLHPAVWWIDSRLSLEREMACDDRVLAETANPRGYAKCLVALLEKSAARRGWALAQALVHRAREASLRLARILDPSRASSRPVWIPVAGLVGVFSVACLMVAPRAPQFVAFEGRSPAIQAQVTQPESSNESAVTMAVARPAVIRTASPSSPKKIPARSVASSTPRLREQRPAAVPSVVAVRWSPDADGIPAESANVEANQSMASPTEALLIIRTSQRVGPNSWVWSVGVWRVTFVNSTQDGVERVPAPRKT